MAQIERLSDTMEPSKTGKTGSLIGLEGAYRSFDLKSLDRNGEKDAIEISVLDRSK
jgi:hypothetical protein